MARVKVKLQDAFGKVIQLDPNATRGATLGADIYLPSGVAATPATFRAWLGVSTTQTTSGGGGGGGGGAPGAHSQLQGLTVGNDHPQYLRVDVLTTPGDLYVRGTTAPERFGIGADGQVLSVSGGSLTWGYRVEQVVAGGGIEVDDYDPAAPVVSLDPTFTFITDAPEPGLPGSRYLVEGENIFFDTSVPGQFVIYADVGVEAVLPGLGIDVQDYDPAFPEVSIDPTLTFLTVGDDTTQLPGSRALTAGTNVTFDDTTPGVLTVSATGGVEAVLPGLGIDVQDYDPAFPEVSIDPTLTFLTVGDDTTQLPGSRVLAAGTNVTFDDTTPGVLTVSATGGGGGGDGYPPQLGYAGI